MEDFASFLMKSVSISGRLFAYYQLVLKNCAFHSFNRLYLNLTVILSLIVPLLHLPALNQSNEFAKLNIVDSNGHLVNSNSDEPDFISGLLFAVFLGVGILLLSILFRQIISIYGIRRKYPKSKRNGYTFIETDAGQAPFSFFNNLFWRADLLMSDTYSDRIFRHELTHITQMHTFDRLFLRVVCSIIWINPFYWLIQDELAVVHEFLADSQSVEKGNTEAFALMLMSSYNRGGNPAPSHQFFNSKIKRRLLMINSSKRTSFSIERKVMALLLSAGVILMLCFIRQPKIIRCQLVENLPALQDTTPPSLMVVGFHFKKVDSLMRSNSPYLKSDSVIVLEFQEMSDTLKRYDSR